MNINRYNYEEYFLLYTDNELSAAERLAVERFIEENPDLKSELILFAQAGFSKDDDIVFKNKEILMRSEINEAFIDAGNCEELFILYADDELKNDEKVKVEEFVYKNPIYQESFERIQSIKLKPDSSLTFPFKKSLLRYEKDSKPAVIGWWKVAAAAVVLVFAGVLWLNNKPSSKTHIPIVKAGANKAEETAITKEQHRKAPTVANSFADKQMAGSTTPSSENLAQVARETTNRKKHTLKAALFIAERSSIAYRDIKGRSEESNKITRVADKAAQPLKPGDTKIGEVIKAESTKEAVAVGKINQAELNSKTIRDLPVMKHENSSSYSNNVVLTSSLSDENITLSDIPAERKNSLRGLFRKATRLIDKTTSFRPVKRPGLAIGNIEIAFQ